jgi:hypothetical protein
LQLVWALNVFPLPFFLPPSSHRVQFMPYVRA